MKNCKILYLLCEIYEEKKKLTHMQWDSLYKTVIDNPRLCREILEAVYPELYAIRFSDLFNLLLDHPKEYERFQYMPQIIADRHRFPGFRMDLVRTVAAIPSTYANEHHIYRVEWGTGDGKRVFEIKNWRSQMAAETIYPLKGICTSSSHVPYFARPDLNGYRHGKMFSWRGYQEFLIFEKDVRDLSEFILMHPFYCLSLLERCNDSLRQDKNFDKWVENGSLPFNNTECSEVLQKSSIDLKSYSH